MLCFISYYNILFLNGSMELHVAENYYHTLGCREATCSFHLEFLTSLQPSPKVKELREVQY
jgi:hypothetical protein